MASLMDILRQAGFSGQALQMAYAIAMAESSGNAHAYNGNVNTGDNSYGLFQINMLGGMGPERRARYGLSSNSDLFDPLTNARVAYAMSNGGRNWTPWSTYLSGAYRQYLGGSSAAVTYSGGMGVDTTTARLDPGTLAGMYGLASATINANGELKRLFSQAVSGQWSADRFTAALKNTRWWRTTSDSARQFFMLKTSDPATFAAKWQQAAMHANDIGVKLGIWNMASEGTSFNGRMDQLLRRAALHVMQDGWNDAQLTDFLGQYVRVNNGVMWGQAGEQWDALHQYAYQQGMQYHSQWYYNVARQIVSGQTTLENAQATIRHQAAARYGAWADQINAGQNVLDLAAPYIKAVSDILEVPQGSVDLTNKYVQQAMTGKTQASLWQFEDTLRNDPTWVKTDNARESIMGVAHTVLKDFGLAF